MYPFAVNPVTGLWERNAVLNGRNSYYVTGRNEGTLSIKTVLNGHGYWETPEGRHRVEPGSYLVLNKGQSYGVDIRSHDVVETFCVFFRPGFAEGVAAALDLASEQLLDQPSSSRSVGFYERMNPGDDAVLPLVGQLRLALLRGMDSELEADEHMTRIAAALLRSQLESVGQRDNLNFAKASTRDELFKRLNVARDYIMAHVDGTVDLKEIAKAACLSPFHFHRLFKRAFGQTPHEFLSSRRLAKAKRLLAKSEMPVTEIAWAVGFETSAAFSKFFSKSTGSSPRAFRKTS
jgi:AraC family transcriptional regulator